MLHPAESSAIERAPGSASRSVFPRILCVLDAASAPETVIAQAVAFGGTNGRLALAMTGGGDRIDAALDSVRASGVAAKPFPLDLANATRDTLRLAMDNDLLVLGARPERETQE